MSESLFRQEMLRAQQQPLFGERLFYQPIPLRIFVAALVAIALVFGAFAALVPLQQTVRVRGYLDPEQGAMKVFSAAVGTIETLFVEDGQWVQQGQILATVRRGEFDANGQASLAYAMGQIDTQIEQLEQKRRLVVAGTSLTIEQLTAQVLAAHEERKALQAEREMLAKRLALGERELARQTQLVALGQTASAQQDRALDGVYATSQAMLNLDATLKARAYSVLTLEQQRAQEPLARDAQLLDIETTLAQLLSRRKEMEVGQSFSVTAPRAGIVSNLFLYAGATVDPRVPFLSLLPTQNALQALLYVPSRALGKLALDQPVLLDYDAYPSRMYGYFPARIARIANTVVDPREHLFPLDLQEPVFLVRAAPEIEALAQIGTLELRSGMQFSAYVVTGQQSLLQRVLAPLHSLRSRM